MSAMAEKGGGSFRGLKPLLCENPLRALIGERLGIPERLVHINVGSELILRQLFDRIGQQVHLLTPRYTLFPEIARHYMETRLPAANRRFVAALTEALRNA